MAQRSRSHLPHWGWFLLATVILAVGAPMLSIWMPYRHEQQLIQTIEASGGSVVIETVAPVWLLKLAGEDRIKDVTVFERVSMVELNGAAIPESEIARLKALTNLQRLYLHGTEITDAELSKLSTLPRLKHLDISKTAVTDVGLAHVSRLQSLEALDVHATAVTDAGLAHLSRLKHLCILHLDSTAVTSNGVASLKKALPGCDFIR